MRNLNLSMFGMADFVLQPFYYTKINEMIADWDSTPYTVFGIIFEYSILYSE